MAITKRKSIGGRNANAKVQRKMSSLLGKSKKKDFQSYMSQLDDLLKKNKGQGVFAGEDVAPRNIIRSDRKFNRGIGVQKAMERLASLTKTPQKALDRLAEIPQPQADRDQGLNLDQLNELINKSINAPQIGKDTESLERSYQGSGRIYGVQQLQDGGVLYNDGSIRYEDGTIRDTGSDSGATPIAQTADGSIRYSDGSVKRPQTFEEFGAMTKAPEGIMSVEGDRERILYDDNNIRFGKYQTEEGQGPQFQSGIKGVSEAIFGDPNQTVTQKYGNTATAGLGYNRHMGTDFRVKDLPGAGAGGVGAPASFQLGGTVFAVGDANDGNPYGNYVVIDVDGHKIQFSHLDSTDVQVGQPYNAGDQFGSYGNSGNSTHAHVDVQYFSPDQQFDQSIPFTSQMRQNRPKNVIEFANNVLSNPQGFQKIVDGQTAPGEIVPQDQLSTALQDLIGGTEQRTEQRTGQTVDASQAVPGAQEQQGQVLGAQAPQEFKSPIRELTKDVGSNILGGAATAAEGVRPAVQAAAAPITAGLQSGPAQRAGSVLGASVASGINEMQPTGKTDFGITEGLITPEASQARLEGVKASQPSRGLLGRARQSLGNITEAVGDYAGLPESNISEAIAGGPTRHTNQVQASEIQKAQRENQQAQPGESLGVKDFFSKNLDQFGRNAQDIAGDIGERGQEELSKAGEGVSSLKDSLLGAKNGFGSTLGNVFRRPGGADITEERAIGDSPTMSSESLLPTEGRQKRDTRDSFFKSGLDKAFGSFLNKVDTGGALTLDMFKPDFFHDISRVGAVFGGKGQEAEATDKFVD